MGVKSTVLMKVWIHINGNVAEYTSAEPSSSGQYYDLTGRIHGDNVWFSGQEYCENGVELQNWHGTKEEAIQAAMDYHETEGCALYLELYPAPEKGDWAFIAQDYSGKWWGYKDKPVIREAETVWTESRFQMSEGHISQSPPNPFWRKTLR